MSETVTQQLIARKLRLSRATVCKSLRHDATIRPETRARVIALANRLGYRLPARPTPDTEVHTTVSVVFRGRPHGGNTAYHDWGLLAGVSEAAQRAEVSLNVAALGDLSALGPEDLPPSLRQGRSRGIVVLHRLPAPTVEYLACRWPTVLASSSAEGQAVDWVDIDADEAANVLVERLLAAGHRRIGYVGEAINLRKRRFAGCVDALARRGMDFPRADVVNVWSTVDSVEGIAGRIVDRLDCGTTGWVFARGSTAASTIDRLAALGVRVPEDVSVAAFSDGLDPDDPRLQRLSAVITPFKAIGAAALELLLGRLNRPPDVPRRLLLNCPMQHGATIAPPPGMPKNPLS